MHTAEASSLTARGSSQFRKDDITNQHWGRRTFMRKVLMTAVAVGLLLAGQVYAADGGAVPAAKIGVVDMQTVATQSVPAQAAKTTMAQ